MSDSAGDVAAECQQLVIKFGWYADHFEDDATIDLFTP